MRSLLKLIRILRQSSLKFMAASSSTKASPRVYLQVLGAETEDTSPSLFIFADSQRYLFNCGEGTQRIFNEQKLKLTRINNIFLTRICWEYIGGLPGMAMTLRDNGKSEIRLLGPSNLSDFIHATRFFLYHESLKFDCVGFSGSDGEEYKDENLTVKPVIINESHQLSKSHEVEPDHEPISKSLHALSCSSHAEDDLPSSKKLKLDFKMSAAVSYICQLAPLPGRFFPQKATELGVPKGPLFGKLQSGKPVTLQDGREIQPELVMEASQPGPLFMIIDCPTVDYIPSLVTNEQLRQYWQGQSHVTPVVIVHLTPMIVFENEEYKQWRERFGDKVSHMVINKDVCATPLIFQSQATIQCKLHCIDAEIFPLLETYNIPDATALPKNCFAGENSLQFHLRPVKQQGFDRTNIPQTLNIDSILQETQALLAGVNSNGINITGLQQRIHNRTELATSLDLVRSISTNSSSGSQDFMSNLATPSIISSKNCIRDTLEAVGEKVKSIADSVGRKAQQFFTNCGNYEVVFLGTGASVPSKYRNVSSTLINMSNQGSVLLDCGEGTYGQLYRHYGKCVDQVLSHIKCVFISHIHADHHLGLIRILKKRETFENSCSPLLVIAPDKIRKWLQEYDTMCEDITYRFVDTSDLVVHRDGDYLNVCGHLEAEEVLTVPVDHCPDAYGLVLKHKHGWKIVYSGDTRPCPALIEAGKEADLLIHEATLEDELKTEALAKKHSTTTEAIESGVKMEAKFIMLNHFSQRYPKIPVFSEQFTKYTGIAFDHMRINSSNFSRIPQLLGPLQTVFAEEIDEMNKAK